MKRAVPWPLKKLSAIDQRSMQAVLRAVAESRLTHIYVCPQCAPKLPEKAL